MGAENPTAACTNISESWRSRVAGGLRAWMEMGSPVR
jgi:hypothetical protein